MPRKSPKSVNIPRDDTRLSPETIARRSKLDLNDPVTAVAIADFMRAEERLKQLEEEQPRQKRQQHPGPTDGWKLNPFYEDKVYDGHAKKMRPRTRMEQSPEFHVVEGARTGRISLGGLVNFCIMFRMDAPATLAAVANLMQPAHPANGKRCLVALVCDADGRLLLDIKYMEPPLTAIREPPVESPTPPETCVESEKPPVEPVTKPDGQKKSYPLKQDTYDIDFIPSPMDDEDIFP